MSDGKHVMHGQEATYQDRYTVKIQGLSEGEWTDATESPYAFFVMLPGDTSPTKLCDRWGVGRGDNDAKFDEFLGITTRPMTSSAGRIWEIVQSVWLDCGPKTVWKQVEDKAGPGYNPKIDAEHRSREAAKKKLSPGVGKKVDGKTKSKKWEAK